MLFRSATRVIFFGATKETTELAPYMLEHPQLGQRPVAFISNGETQHFQNLPLPNIQLKEQSLLQIISETGAATIVISPAMKENKDLVKMLFQVIPLGVNIIEFPAFHEMLTGKIPLSLIEEAWFLENLIGKSKPRYEFLKRIVDIVLAIVLGTVGLILLPFIILGILLSQPMDILHYREKRARLGDGVIFFRQKRVGRNGKIFDFVKFRSQILGAEKLSQKMNEAKETLNDQIGRAHV